MVCFDLLAKMLHDCITRSALPVITFTAKTELNHRLQTKYIKTALLVVIVFAL